MTDQDSARAADGGDDVLTQLKIALMQGIDNKLSDLYGTQLAAEAALDIPQPRLSKLRACQVHEFSVGWLLLLADRIGVRLTITVE